MGYNTIDLIVAGIVLLFAVVGIFTGFLSQFFGLVALVAAFLLSRPVGTVVGNFIAARSETPESAAYVIGCFIAGIAIFSGAKLIFYIITRLVTKNESEGIKTANRIMGGVFGGAKAFVVTFLLLCLVAAFPQYFEGQKPNVYGMLQNSHVGGLIDKYNPVKQSRVTGGVRGFVRLLQNDPQAIEEIRRDPEVAEFLDVVKRKMMENAESEEARQRIKDGEMPPLTDFSKLMELMNDPEVREAFQQIDLSKTLDEAADQKK